MIEQAYPFITQRIDIPAEHIAHVKHKADAAALLELHPVADLETPANDAAIFMFKGELYEADCKAGGSRGLVIGANKYAPAFLRVEGGSVYTLWSPKGTIVGGFVKAMILQDERMDTPGFQPPIPASSSDKYAGSFPPGHVGHVRVFG